MSAWKAADVKRLVRTLEAVGKVVTGVEIDPEGKISVLTEGSQPEQRVAPLDRWRAKRGARAA